MGLPTENLASGDARLPRVIGSVPEEYRHFFPEVSVGVSYRGYLGFGQGELFPPDKLPARIRPLTPVINQVIELGDMDLRKGECIRVGVVRKWSDELATHRHSDPGPGVAPLERFRRVVVNDHHGTLHAGPDGVWRPTPDFGMLLLESGVEHEAQDPQPPVLRTRLLVTRDRRNIRYKSS
jgi:hypothetical protein